MKGTYESLFHYELLPRKPQLNTLACPPDKQQATILIDGDVAVGPLDSINSYECQRQ